MPELLPYVPFVSKVSCPAASMLKSCVLQHSMENNQRNQLMSRLTLCGRDNEAKRSTCKACKAPRWDWQLHSRLAAILQRRDLHTLSLQQVLPLLMMSKLRALLQGTEDWGWNEGQCDGIYTPELSSWNERSVWALFCQLRCSGKPCCPGHGRAQ